MSDINQADWRRRKREFKKANRHRRGWTGSNKSLHTLARLGNLRLNRRTWRMEKRVCLHDFQGWREFENGLGGEQVCTKCGLGAMAWTLANDPWI
jgi:hypothetical protein